MRKLVICTSLLILLALIYQKVTPGYHIVRSDKFVSGNYVESTATADVYRVGASRMIEEEFLRVNGRPSRLILKLRIFGWTYRTVVFDYEPPLLP